MNRLGHFWRRILGRRPSRAPSADPLHSASHDHPHVQAIRYLVVREACGAALTALQVGQIDQADLHVQHACSLDAAHPDAIRLRALLAIARGRPLEAVDLLERAASSLPNLHLLMQLARLQSGQREAAHLDLHAWARQPSCPPQARQLLAYLEHAAGDDVAACAVLQHNLHDRLDPAGAQVLYLIQYAAGLHDSARHTAALLAHGVPHHQPTRIFRHLMGLADQSDAQLPLRMIDQLAVELIEQPSVIPSLVVAQKYHPQPQRIELLRRAIHRIVDDLSEPLTAILALAELALLADDPEDARRWALRGLRLDAYHAKLAMLLDRADRLVDDSDPAEVRAHLQRAVVLHGEYPDLRDALVRTLARATGEQAA